MSEELKPCPFCGDSNAATGLSGYTTCRSCGADGPVGGVDAWNRRAAPIAAQLDAELPPIEYDQDMDRTYIPLPDGWEIQTKGKGSTFRIAHASSDTRWLVLDEKLHEPLEAMARDTRNLMAQYAERIRLLDHEAITQKLANQVLRDRVAFLESERNLMEANLRAYIDGRTAGTAPDAAPGPWRVLHEDSNIAPARKLDVVLTNGVTLYAQTYQQIDWTQVADWRYAAPSPQENTND